MKNIRDYINLELLNQKSKVIRDDLHAIDECITRLASAGIIISVTVTEDPEKQNDFYKECINY